MTKIILAITTFNRLACLRHLLESFEAHYDRTCEYKLLIADDGSTDGTPEFLAKHRIDELPIQLIRNHRQGVHHQFNSIVRQLQHESFDVCFKCDDDIFFRKAGWETLYLSAMRSSGFDHLCFFDPSWRPEKNTNPIEGNGVVSRCLGKDVQGAFFTLTPEVIRCVGFMDTANFGFRGVGHIDYSLRAARLHFNDVDHPFDAAHSNEYIRTQANCETSLPSELVTGIESASETQRKYALLKEPRAYLPDPGDAPSMDAAMEGSILREAVQTLLAQKAWYEGEIQNLKTWEKEQYGHLPGWFVRIGKIFKRIR